MHASPGLFIPKQLQQTPLDMADNLIYKRHLTSERGINNERHDIQIRFLCSGHLNWVSYVLHQQHLGPHLGSHADGGAVSIHGELQVHE